MPAFNDDVTIPDISGCSTGLCAYPTIDDVRLVKKLTIASGATLTITAGSLSASNAVNINGELIINSGGSFTQTGNKEINITCRAQIWKKNAKNKRKVRQKNQKELLVCVAHVLLCCVETTSTALCGHTTLRSFSPKTIQPSIYNI